MKSVHKRTAGATVRMDTLDTTVKLTGTNVGTNPVKTEVQPCSVQCIVYILNCTLYI